MRPEPVPPGPGQESVWDYPRPPRVEAVGAQVEVIFGGQTIALTLHPLRVLETSHPPVYYLPVDSVVPGVLVPTGRTTFCEYKGVASYFTVTLGAQGPSGPIRAGGQSEVDAAWAYEDPSPGYEQLAGYVSFYPGRMEVCLVDGDFVLPQPGGFYGGWIVSSVVGPFKGVPGSAGW